MAGLRFAAAAERLLPRAVATIAPQSPARDYRFVRPRRSCHSAIDSLG